MSIANEDYQAMELETSHKSEEFVQYSPKTYNQSQSPSSPTRMTTRADTVGTAADSRMVVRYSGNSPCKNKNLILLNKDTGPKEYSPQPNKS